MPDEQTRLTIGVTVTDEVIDDVVERAGAETTQNEVLELLEDRVNLGISWEYDDRDAVAVVLDRVNGSGGPGP
jgi:hypothetical protein